jgi:2-alkenal reductase
MMHQPGSSSGLSIHRIGFLLLAALALALSGFAGAGVGGAAVYFVLTERGPSAPSPSQPPAAVPASISSVEINTAVTDAVSRVSPAVVTVVNHLPAQQSLFGQTVEPVASGSGVIISTDGTIITNNHVVDNADHLEVILSSGTTLDASLVGVDPFADLAVVRAEGEMPAAAAWGDSDQLKPGETVIAIGSPLGEFVNTVTVGVISATDRSIQTNPGFQLEGLLQTDAAINQGNSGGPLVNLAGQVVGINTLVVRGNGLTSSVAEGLGFAISSNTARAVIEQLITNGFVAHPYLGINWQPINPQLAELQSLPVEYGVLITSVDPDGPVAAAGLRQGDILTGLGGEMIDRDVSFINLLFRHLPGETVTIRVLRGDEDLQVSVVLAERPRT